MDLLTAFQECRVRYLLNLVLVLPRNSLTGEAMSDDDELVASLMDGRADDGKTNPIRMAEFSAEVEALFTVADRLGDVVAGLVGLGGKKPPKVPPQRRPRTAYERVSHQRFLERHERLKRQLLPNG